MKRKKVLICGIRDFEKRNTNKYFISKDEGKILFCNSIVSGEGEAKKILSTVDIDEIIAIGSIDQENTSQLKKIPLNEGIDLMTADVDKLSDFDFFRYRLMQYVMNVNIDSADFYDDIEPERRESLIEGLKTLFGESLSQALPIFFQIEGMREKVLEQFHQLSEKEQNWIKCYFFSVLDERNRMQPHQHNVDIPISYIPISNSFQDDSVTLLRDLIEELVVEDGVESDLYVDLHSFSIETSMVCINTLYTLSDDPNTPIYIRGITNATNTVLWDVYEISMQQKRYRTERLMSGINTFLNNGKTDILRAYWEEAKEENPNLNNEYINQILLAMGYVDWGISLCCPGELKKGIGKLRDLLQYSDEYTKESENEEEALMIMMIKRSVFRDFGPLMEVDPKNPEKVDTFELIKWGYRKKFYQQVITIIESLIPSDVIDRGILYPIQNEEEKKAYIKAINAHYWDSLVKDRYIFRSLDHYFMKSYGRFAIDFKDHKKSVNEKYIEIRVMQVFGDPMKKNVLPAYSNIEDEALLREFLNQYYSIGALRNTINHANELIQGEKTEELTGVSAVWKEVSERLKKFIDCYQKVLEHIQGKPCNAIKISQDELFDYIYEHGPKKDPDFLEVEGYTSQRNSRRKPDKDSDRKPNENTGRKPEKYRRKKWDTPKEKKLSNQEVKETKIPSQEMPGSKPEQEISTVIPTPSISEQKKEIHLHIHLSLD